MKYQNQWHKKYVILQLKEKLVMSKQKNLKVQKKGKNTRII